ncbi:MAG TPA: hypothetical protein VM536_11640 [Chloroflexia bacterium]|nr:hypothetical protein [Chloroflexia bacterium]
MGRPLLPLWAKFCLSLAAVSLLLLLAGLTGQPALHLFARTGPPPHWPTPPLYPGARGVATSALPHYPDPGNTGLMLPNTDLLMGADSRVTFYVFATPESVLAWYRQQLTAAGWRYTARSTDGWSERETTTGFWHYTWSAEPGLTADYGMDIEATDTAPTGAAVTILISQSRDWPRY